MSGTEYTQGLRIEYGASETGVTVGADGVILTIGIPVLGGPAVETPMCEGGEVWENQGFVGIRGDEMMCGVLVEEAEFPMEDSVRGAYRRLFEVCGRNRLYRIWNFVPRINELSDGLENYRSFNAGRRRAYVEAFGGRVEEHMPAASAVGIESNMRVLVFLGGRVSGSYVENPEQVPAYRYPPVHGASAPCFSRGAVVSSGARQLGFVSGTASIKGHLSLGQGDVERQTDRTLKNIELVREQMGMTGRRWAAGDCGRHFKVYLRNPRDYPDVRGRLGAAVGPGPRETTYLRADICRAELDVEIEVQYTCPPAGIEAGEERRPGNRRHLAGRV